MYCCWHMFYKIYIKRLMLGNVPRDAPKRAMRAVPSLLNSNRTAPNFGCGLEWSGRIEGMVCAPCSRSSAQHGQCFIL
jgi:hypothetical protein